MYVCIIPSNPFIYTLPHTINSHVVHQANCIISLTVFMSNPTPLFPPIGAVADETDKLKDDQGPIEEVSTQPREEEDRPVQEIGSLCMECGQQVCYYIHLIWTCYLIIKEKGRHETSSHIYTVLPGSDSDVLPLRALRISK